MNNSTLKFTFPKSVQALEKYAVQNYQIPQHEPGIFLAKCLADLPAFMAVFLDTDDGFGANKLKKKYSPPTEKVFFMTEQKRGFLRAKGKVREPEIYPLTEAELIQAKDFLKDHPELTEAVALTQACLVDYIEKLSFRLLDLGFMSVRSVESAQIKPFESKFYAFKKEIEGFSFLRDLLPIMASSMAKSGAQEITTRDAGLALCDAFRLQAFKSHQPNNPARPQPKLCPFGVLATKVFSLQVSVNEQGKPNVAEGGKPGSLLVSLMAFQSQKLQPATANVSAPEPQENLGVS